MGAPYGGEGIDMSEPCAECGHDRSEHKKQDGIPYCALIEMSHTTADGKVVEWDQHCDCDGWRPTDSGEQRP